MSTISKNICDFFNEAYSAVWHEDVLELSFRYISDDNIVALEWLDEHAKLEGVDIEHVRATAPTFTVQARELFFQTLEKALNREDVRLGRFSAIIVGNEPHNFIFLSNEKILIEKDISTLHHAYKNIIRFIKVLTSLSDRCSVAPDNELYFYFAKEDIVLNYDYSINLLQKLSTEQNLALERFNKEFTSTDKASDKVRIFKQTIFVWKNNQRALPKDKIFSELVQDISSILHRYEIEYELFTTKFSFKNLQNSINVEVANISQRIDSCLIGIQDKIVAIPIAESIMLLQMESDNFVKNILLFLVGLLTSALMYRFLSLQGNNLSFLREEMKHKLLAVNNIPKTKVEIKGDFERLQKRIEDHFKFIMHIKILLVIANIISACFVIVYSYSCISKHVLSLIQKCVGFL
jgi:hypothetical protein